MIKINKHRGVTLIDLIATVAIVIVLLLASLPAYTRAMKKSEIRLAAYSLASLINLAKTNAQYPPSISKEQITGYCVVYNKQKHEMDLIETIDNSQSKCTNGKLVQKNDISQRITVECSECEVFYNANNVLSDRELKKNVKFRITGDNSNYAQTILISKDNIDVGN